MNTLADEFLADLGDEAQPQQEVEEEGEGMATEELSTDTQQFSQLVYSERLRNMLERVDEALNSEASKPLKISGAEEGEYALVIESNKMAVEIAEEISKLSRFIKEKYKKKFPELESLVLNPLDYARVVLRIGNEMDVSGMDFSDILPAATIMVVTVTATTSSGTPLEESELKVVQEACHLTLTAEEARKKIMEFVESRMGVIAPNLSTIVGSSIAAKMIGAVGGLSNLSKMPSSNIQSLGSTRKHLGGFSAATVKQYAGFIWDCEIILKTPPSLRSKAARVLAGKCTLAARCDAYDEDPAGSAGRDLREEILRKIDKWQEPPPIKLPKPLPAPDDRPKKKRGGKRMRQIKQKYAMTELRKQANRMAFGTEAQETYRNTANTLGMLGVTGGGKVRLSAVDKGILKKQKQKSFGSSGATSGLSSSLAFTPVQGLELSNPDAAQKVKQANEKYFGISTFARVNKTS